MIGKRLIGVLINNPDLVRLCKEKGVIEYIRENEIREVLSRIFDYFEKNQQLEVNNFIDLFDKEALRELVLSAVLNEAEYDEPEPERVVLDYFKHLERNFIKEESQRITEKLSEAEKLGDQGEIMVLLQRKKELLNLLKSAMTERGNDAE